MTTQRNCGYGVVGRFLIRKFKKITVQHFACLNMHRSWACVGEEEINIEGIPRVQVDEHDSANYEKSITI